MNLKDQVCVITGGTSGIGLATVRLFAEHGARQVVVGLEDEACVLLKKDATSQGWDLETVTGDVGVETTWRDVLNTAARMGPVDVLVNNAGYGLQGSVVDTSLTAWEDIIRTNVTGVFLGSKAVVPQMIEQGRGSVVNVASVAGSIGMSRRAAYCASKAAVVGLTRAMAVDHSEQGVRVNAVAPGTTDSPYFAKIAADVEDPEAYRVYLEDRQLLRRLADPREIAEAILFLASDAGSFATGSVVTVDGGMSVA
jgi:NAD(P)-dependent dehydrogenase (short-subunit alcohol dehydrogenase family)